MPIEREWSKIGSGGAFEGLVTTIIYFEDPTASLFGRAGADGGQDARSGDGTLVYQMKHHVAATPSKAISDAKAEATKIKEYRHPAHGRYAEWSAVKKWRLVTNASFNPADQQRWDTEVVPAFQALGLEASLWELATLEALLAKHPEVDRAFFGGENRVFLTLPEVRGRPSFEPEFIARGAAAGFEGRAGEIAKVLDFANGTQAFLVVHGPGGIGKTRLLLEAGELLSRSAWQVLWANTSTMESSGSWYEGIVPGRKTLVIVDEPESEQVLRQLVEQVGSAGGALDWKIAVSVRTPKDPVLRFLSGPKVKTQVQNLAIGALPRDASIEMCKTLLSTGPLSPTAPEALARVATELARRFDDHPVWLALAVHVLEQAGDLGGVPDTAEDLAELYLTEIVESQNEFDLDKLVNLLRWIALLGTANLEDKAALATLAAAAEFGTETAVRAAIARLIKRRALTSRG
ncbi:MAG: ATP-binding protein, partial [Dehalococcoidia bacterium]|nr:ATP-binding protein [Dehalococcoidia bacterium]